MNLRSFLVGMFRGFAANGELEEVREAGRQHAREVAGAYVQGFQEEASRLLLESQQRFLSHDDTIEAEYVRLPEPTSVSRASGTVETVPAKTKTAARRK